MYLKSLHLCQFRNYLEQQVAFTAPKAILLGENAQGKSNLLEAVELLATVRSHRTSRDRDLILEGQSTASITAQVKRDLGEVDLSITLRQGSRRVFSINGERLRRQIDFLGMVNAVQFSSLDLDLVRGNPEQRRHWLDGLLIQLEPIYAHLLHQYNHILKQRNALLKERQRCVRESLTSNTQQSLVSTDPQFRASQSAMEMHQEAIAEMSLSDQLALWDAQLATAGTHLIRRRARALIRLAPLANHWHQAISGSRETLAITYTPNVPLEQDDPQAVQQLFLEKLQARATAEQFQGATLVGPHRDEISFTINQASARQYGSQGQQRTLVLALKLAELQLIEMVTQEPPLLLLDDVLAELDLNRQNQLLEAIQDRFQTFITTTHLGAFDAQWLQSSQILVVKAGRLAQE